MDVKDSCIFRANWLNAAHTIENPVLRCAFFEAVLQYALTGMKTEAPAELSLALNVIYSLIDIDREKYDKKIEKRREAGRRGAMVTNEMRWGNQQTSAKSANADIDDSNQQTSAKSAYTVTDTDTETDTGTVTDKDNDFNYSPIPPKGGGALSFYDFYSRVAEVKVPKEIKEIHYENQYVWRVAEGQVGYALEVKEAIKTKSEPYLSGYIQTLNGKYPTSTPFQQLRLCISMAKLKTEHQRKAFMEELKRSEKEPDIFRTLTEKADYIAQGNKVANLAGFLKSRKK